MKRILVIGGSGTLGRSVIGQLLAVGHQVRATSRRVRSGSELARVEWAQSDLRTGSGLRTALEGVEVVVHCATNPAASSRVDIRGTERVLEAARAAAVEHFIFPSIVGIDSHPFRYYRAKLAAEKLIEQSGVPWTILRATQFHSLVDQFLAGLSRLPWIFLLSRLRFQSVSVDEVAAQLVRCVTQGPCGRQPDVGGPEVLSAEVMAERWLAARGLRKRVVQLYLPGRTAAAFRRGDNLLKQGLQGRITWDEWLADRASRSGIDART
jgi:uncharacterized protein YbjT (DUF2867 family)